MENYFYNSDFEEKLFLGKTSDLQITKKTTEFEYFIHLLNPEYSIYSSKIYDENYQNWISEFSGERIKTTRLRNNVIPWCNDYSQLELSKKLQSKEGLLLYLQKKGCVPNKVEKVISVGQLKENYLYKLSNSQSGGGHMLYPRDEKRIVNCLAKGYGLIAEKLLQRTFDFSTLYYDGKRICIYQNEVDSKFQYKGSVIGPAPSFLDDYLIEYEKTMALLVEYADGFKGFFSVDSFLFTEKGTQFLYPACEINARKSMGHIAYQLKQKYFSHRKILKMKLIINRKEKMDYKEIKKEFKENVYLVSPVDNKFFVFILLADNQSSLAELEGNLLSRFF